MELSKQEMELFFLLPELQSKNIFYKNILTFTNDPKTGIIQAENGFFSPTSWAQIKKILLENISN